ncbi:PASTA domain-containing protein [Paenibacillus sp. N3.4]|uniref:PASTA domain-containing protein n=1 Tax=Paenibacillus sp. N3.4 TaxID=2603222 RepID=UPI00164EE9C9|nr:PASTA domain-containing protein [Paenibacillus sp. N3.4]
MHNKIGTRYMPKSPIVSFQHGTMQYGEDVFLTRTVILYTKNLTDGESGEDYIRTLSHKAAFNHESFHHILDTSFDEHAVTIILQSKPGKLFSQELHNQVWTYDRVIPMIADLGVSLLDGMEELITGFSVATDNLWLDDNGRLSIINYWEEGDQQVQGSVGLCRLMIQLFTGTSVIPGPFEVMHTHLERMTIPSATQQQKEALIKLIKLMCQGQASISSFIFGLRSLPSASASASASTAPRREEAILLLDENETEDESPVQRPFTKIGIGAGAVVVVALGVWMIWPSSKAEHKATVIPSATAKPVAATTPSSVPTSKATPSATTADKLVELAIPDLTGLTQEEAEKKALSMGLHYKFIIEAAEQPSGIVIKQSPEAGTKGFTGDNVTFWVSKGTP